MSNFPYDIYGKDSGSVEQLTTEVVFKQICYQEGTVDVFPSVIGLCENGDLWHGILTTVKAEEAGLEVRWRKLNLPIVSAFGSV